MERCFSNTQSGPKSGGKTAVNIATNASVGSLAVTVDGVVRNKNIDIQSYKDTALDALGGITLKHSKLANWASEYKGILKGMFK